MRRLYAAALAGLLLAGGSAAAQDAPNHVALVRATRPELEAYLRSLEDAVASPKISQDERAELRLRLAMTRTRLEVGDFQPGDRVSIKVEHDAPVPASAASGAKVESAPRSLEQQLSDTFTVGSHQEIDLPVIGGVSLRGVLRAELEPYLTSEIGRFIREPVLHAQALIRLSVQGAVARPGFYTLPLDAALSDAVMSAGGPVRSAKMEKLRVERDGKPMLEGSPLRRAIAEGRTLGEMRLAAGDQVILPEGRPFVAERVLRMVGLALAIPVAIVAITRD